jgi:hypothetical protein
MNGLGNSLEHYLIPLVAGVLSDRASFQQRNAAGCDRGSSCAVIDVGEFTGAAFDAGCDVTDWRWSEALAGELRGRGVVETVLEFDDAQVGFVEVATGLHIPGALDMLALLSHPDVASKPWVRIDIGDSNRRGAADKLWQAAIHRPVWTGFFTDLLNEAVNARLSNGTSAQCDVYTRRRCLAGIYLRPRPEFQAVLMPHVARLDAARAGGGIAIGMHVRTQYADHAAYGSTQPVRAVAAFSGTVAERRAAQWTALDHLYPPQCREVANASTRDDAGAPLCAQWLGPAPAALSSRSVSCVINATNTSKPAFAFGTDEVKPDTGLMTTLLSCAANWAASGGPPSAPWLLYVAGDLPPLFLLANSSASLAGHVDTAEGKLGHVSFAQVCSIDPVTGEHVCQEHGADPGGAWTRTMVDWWMLGACEGIMRMGISSFPGAIFARVFWPVKQREFAYAIHPLAVERDFHDGFNLGVDELTAELEAELRPLVAASPPPAANSTAASPPLLLPGECLVAQSVAPGLGLQLDQLLHAMAQVPAEQLYWDFSASLYSCCRAGQPCANGGWRRFLGGDEPANLPSPTVVSGETVTFTSPRSNQSVSCKRATLPLPATTRDNATCPGALCQAVHRLWQPSAELQAVIDYEMSNLTLYPPPLVALQVRGSDKLGAPYQFEAGIAWLAANASNLNGTCVVLGDDDALGRNASALARAALGCVVVNRIRHPGRAHVQSAFDGEAPEPRCQRTKQLLVDVEIMARAHALAGLAASNSVRVGVLLRACRQGGLHNAVDWQMRDMLAEACTPG